MKTKIVNVSGCSLEYMGKEGLEYVGFMVLIEGSWFWFSIQGLESVGQRRRPFKGVIEAHLDIWGYV